MGVIFGARTQVTAQIAPDRVVIHSGPVSLWSKIFGKPEPIEPAPAPDTGALEPVVPTRSPDLERLSAVGLPAGPNVDEAVGTFRHLRTTPEEGRAIDELLRVAATRSLPEALALAVASAMIDRGDSPGAIKVLATTTSSPALLMRADLEAERGDVPSALALTERVLAREIDHPGARERRQRWRAAMGLLATRQTESATSTVAIAEPDTPYVLLREIARGGAGAVYEAEDRELGRRVALKVYHEPMRDRPQLEHEARVAVQLAGQGVVRVFDLDPEHGWIALEWAALASLRERLRARDHGHLFPVDRWALPLALALARVHDAGWAHLDVKPANVLLLGAADPVLTDFGISRRLGEPSPAGSMSYVSPERMSGRLASPYDDVYGFGRILEDVLDAATEDNPPWRVLARACTGREAQRPAHARELVMRVRELST